MRLVDLYSGQRLFSGDKAIISALKSSTLFDESTENLDRTKNIQLLGIPKQRTYLISTAQRVYKVLDDRRIDSPKVTWSRQINKVFEGHTLKAVLNLVMRNHIT